MQCKLPAKATTILFCLLLHHASGQNVHNRKQCTKTLERKAWHKLSLDEKHEYIEAEKCLMNVAVSPDTALPVAQTLFQALQEQHQLQSETIHEVGGFLPYHRYMTWAHEHLLRTKCGYTGAQPWWDEERDASHFTNSTIFDAEHGFGGRTPGCLVDGPFAHYSLDIGPGYNNAKHCLSREVDDVSSQAASSFFLQFCKNATTYEEAWDRIEFYPHSAGHSGVGGEMLNPISSPGDPLFYLHHAFIDKLWWDWQTADVENRLYAIGGPTVKDPNRPAPVPKGMPSSLRKRAGEKRATERPSSISNGTTTTTLSHQLSLLGLLPNITAEEVMDIRNELLCYQYV